MKKFLKISICAFITLSMFCGCKADGALDDEKLSDFVNSENGSNEEKTGINCLSVYNSPSGNGIQLMFSNLPDGCNGADIMYKSENDEYWQTTAWIDLSGNNRLVYFLLLMKEKYTVSMRILIIMKLEKNLCALGIHLLLKLWLRVKICLVK